MKAIGAVARAWVDTVPAWAATPDDALVVFDDVLPDPDAVRRVILDTPAQVMDFGGDQVFRGIHVPPADVMQLVIDALATWLPSCRARVIFARQSPAGQIEPNDVHSDVDMGHATAILYLNPTPAEGDGTSFWKRKASGAVRGDWDEDCQADSKDRDAWERWRTVEARYNRLLVFRSDLYHSRAIVENYGVGDDARLILIAFLTDRPVADVVGDA